MLTAPIDQMKILKLNEINIHSFSEGELETKLIDILSGSGKSQIITTFNLDFLRITEQNEEFLHICKNSLWNLPDGKGITTLLRIEHKVKVKRITGNDLFPIILKIAENLNVKIAFIGSTKEVIDRLQKKINAHFKLFEDRMVFISPEYMFEKRVKSNREVVIQVSKFKPDIVFVALGCPRQEIWLYNNMNKLGSKINIGVGSVFDYYTGAKRRSPLFLQQVGLEWLWRLLHEPKRLFKRYIILDLPFFIKKLLWL